MFRSVLAVALSLILPLAVRADAKLPAALPAKVTGTVAQVQKVLPYVQAIHEVLDLATSRESPTTVHVKKTVAESSSEWVVHRVRANVWVERTASNYLGDIGVRVSVPCVIEFGFDLAALKPEHMRFDRGRRLLVIDLPPVTVREPIPVLAEMKIEPKYKGLRGPVLDADAVRALQVSALQQDYQPAARDLGQGELLTAQRKARDLVEAFVRDVLKNAGADIEVIVR